MNAFAIVGIIILAIIFGIMCGYLYSYNQINAEITKQCNDYIQAHCRSYLGNQTIGLNYGTN
jgi:hypothetical protein